MFSEQITSLLAESDASTTAMQHNSEMMLTLEYGSEAGSAVFYMNKVYIPRCRKGDGETGCRHWTVRG
ncbi:MAG: hypothetical protein GF398_20260 [Chitinivibrionales bacterium]|nr:hypothetical protein [Chitinivibrionales bacterium]